MVAHTEASGGKRRSDGQAESVSVVSPEAKLWDR